MRQNYPAYAVRYVSCEAFMNDFVDAIRTNNTTAFKRRYRENDVLLIDDIQFMENKEGLQRSSSTPSTSCTGRPPDRHQLRPATPGHRHPRG